MFAAKNNKTVAQTLVHPKYLHLAELVAANHREHVNRKLGEFLPGEPTKVIYSADRPRPLKIANTTPEHIWYTKSSEWEYEQEWRVTRLLQTAVKTVKNPSGETIPLQEFPKEAVREVILGCRTSAPFDFEVLQALVEPQYHGCSLLRAELDPNAFKLNVIPEPGFRPAR